MASIDARQAAGSDVGRLGLELGFRRNLGFGLRFEPALEREFERSTASSRRRTIFRIGLLQLLFVELAAVGFYLLLRDVGLVVLYAAVLNLYALALHLVLRARPGAFMREAAIMLSVPVWVLMAQILSLETHNTADFWAIQVPIALQPFLLATAIQSRFPFCLFGCGLICLIVVAGTALGSELSVAGQCWIWLIQAVTITYSLFAAWKLEARERGYFLAMRRETERSQQLDTANARLAQLSLTDGLTGIANRRGLEQFFDSLVGQHGIGVIVLDVDYFKHYNDRYGHLAGDHCLRETANVLAANVRQDIDAVGRWGGEEFLMLLSTDDPQHCLDTAQRLCEAVADLAIAHACSPIAPVVTISAGVAHGARNEKPSLSLLFRRADEALYNAKEAGRNRALAEASEKMSDRRNSGWIAQQ